MKKTVALLMVLCLVAIALPSAVCEAQRARGKAAQPAKEQLVDNAKATLEAGGVNLTGVNIIYDDGNTFWQERLAYIEQDTSQNHGILPHGILKMKQYQVVYFDFVESSPIGDTWVFMDPDTGDVIAIYEEKEG